jgi:hypothetical protein
VVASEELEGEKEVAWLTQRVIVSAAAVISAVLLLVTFTYQTVRFYDNWVENIVTKTEFAEAIKPLRDIPEIKQSVSELSRATATLLNWQSEEFRLRLEDVAQKEELLELCNKGVISGTECKRLPTKGELEALKQKFVTH